MTTTAPSVKITITGVNDASSDPTEDDLYMMYVQATKGDKRRQWVMIPPANSSFDGIHSSQDGKHLYITRLQDFPGNRSKWFSHVDQSGETLASNIEDCKNAGWEVSLPVLAKLDLDDYVDFWNGKTSHKALRAVGRALAPFKLSIK